MTKLAGSLSMVAEYVTEEWQLYYAIGNPDMMKPLIEERWWEIKRVLLRDWTPAEWQSLQKRIKPEMYGEYLKDAMNENVLTTTQN